MKKMTTLRKKVDPSRVKTATKNGIDNNFRFIGRFIEPLTSSGQKRCDFCKNGGHFSRRKIKCLFSFYPSHSRKDGSAQAS